MKNLSSLIIDEAYAQTNELIPCQDGSMADPSIGCAEAPSAIVNTQSDVLEIIMKTADAIVTIAVIAAVAVLIYGGIYYAASMGQEEKLKKAKNIIFWSIFGLIVTLLAKYIVRAILLLIGS